jgi:Tol biopolymer transport system component
MEVDGSNQERLTTSGGGEGYLSCSPDGRRIAYGAEGDILTINDDGNWNIALLSGREAFEPAWSPDGTKIAFQSWEHDPSEIYVMDVDGGNLTRLTDNSAYDDYPAWSPDGTKIAFISDRDGNEEIYVMNANGSNQRRLTNHPFSDTFPAWSPDGTEILFQSGRSGSFRGIYIMNANGTNVRMLQQSTTYASNCPFWSPDGTKIVFHSFRDADEAEIYIMDGDGSNVIRLTTNSANDYLPRWVPPKSGVEVTEASVIIPDTSTTKAMTTQEVTELVRKAVVRIETDLASGSGFIIDPSGLIMTNNHVISDAEEITVYLEDGTSHTGTVEARDLVRDLALVKIEATELPYLELGDLSEVSLGQQVVVLGYPLGGENVSVTSGLVSTIDFDSGRNITWVQTDSAINPGNSGGPMLDLRGRVIGVVSAKMVGIAVEGMGFAISANTVIIYLPQLEAGEIIMAFK